MPDFTLVACCTDGPAYERNLASSHDVLSGNLALSVVFGVEHVTKALNELAQAATTPYVVFTHQDVLFPLEWLGDALDAVVWLEQEHPDWGMFGPAGAIWHERPEEVWRFGKLWQNGHLWRPTQGYMERQEVETLDECCIVVHRERFLEVGGFSEDNPGRHFYGADLCFKSPYSAWVMHVPVHHNTQTPQAEITADFAWGAGWMWGAYRECVPFATTCCRVYERNGVMRMEV